MAGRVTCGGASVKFRRVQDWGRGRRPRGDAWRTEKLLRSSGGARRWRSSVAAAAQGLCEAEQGEQAEVGFGAAAVAWRCEGAEGHVDLRRGPGISACEPGRDPGEDCGEAVAARALRGRGRKVCQAGPGYQREGGARLLAPTCGPGVSLGEGASARGV
jgi:hypothetical protein